MTGHDFTRVSTTPGASFFRRSKPIVMGIAVIAVLFGLTGTLAACGAAQNGDGGNGGPTTTSPAPLAHPSGENEVVLQIFSGGGFVPIEYNYTMIPEFSLYGDGRVIVTGPVIEIYPGPAMPNLQTTMVTEEAVQAILQAAREAGLFASAVDYGRPTITDVHTTTFLVNAGGAGHRSDVYALGFETDAGGLTAEQRQARAKLNDLRGRLGDLASFMSGEVVWEAYEYAALAVYSRAVQPGPTPDPTDIQPGYLDWPLGDLSTLGEELAEGFRRLVVSGEDLITLQKDPPLNEATVITRWKSGGLEYNLYFRPLLPDEIS